MDRMYLYGMEFTLAGYCDPKEGPGFDFSRLIYGEQPMATKKTTTTTTTTVTVEDDAAIPSSLLIFVLDRSGSMLTQEDTAWPAVAKFLTEQKATANLRGILVAFDDKYNLVVNNKPMADVEATVFNTYRPRGNTALLDAVGHAVTAGEAISPAPDKVLLVVYTDGHENASTDWTKARLAAKITELRERGWGVLYLGAEQAAWDANDYGFQGSAVSHRSGAVGQSIGAVSMASTAYFAGSAYGGGTGAAVTSDTIAEAIAAAIPESTTLVTP